MPHKIPIFDVCSGTSEADEAKKSWRAVGLPLRQSLISLSSSGSLGWGNPWVETASTWHRENKSETVKHTVQPNR
jgi:hypothetical protein